MAYRSLNGMNDGESQSALKLDVNGTKIDLPDNSYIRDADMTREGMDLVLEGPSGTLVIEGYFTAEPAPNLVAPDGTMLTPDLVHSFAQSNGQYASTGSMNDESPVGAVQEVSGEATVTRADGTTETVSIGTPIFQGDVIETDAEGAVNIIFIDETSFAVSEDARLAIDEFVFDPSTNSGSQNFSVLKGVFVFTSGLIGREDPDDVEIDTPIGSIGIRGTIIAGDITEGEITVVEGAIVLKDFSGNEMTLANQFETAKFNPASGTIENLGEMSANDVGSKFASVSQVSPSLFSSINDAAAEAQEAAQDAQTNDQPATETQGSDDGTQAQPEEAQPEVGFNETEFGTDNAGFEDGTSGDNAAPSSDESPATNSGANNGTNASGDNTDNTGSTAQDAAQDPRTIENTDDPAGTTGAANSAPTPTDLTLNDSNAATFTGTNRGFVTNGNTLTYDVSANFTDVDGDTLTYTINGVTIDSIGGAVPGWITLSGNVLSIAIPDSVLAGEDYSVQIQADDGNGNTSIATIYLDAQLADVMGTTGADTLATVAAEDFILALDGNDTISVDHINAKILAEGGNDVITINSDNADVFAGAGDDTIIMSAGAYDSEIRGDAGDDTVDLNAIGGRSTITLDTDTNGFTSNDGTGNNHFSDVKNITDSTNQNTLDLSLITNTSHIDLNVGSVLVGGVNVLNIGNSFDSFIGGVQDDTIIVSPSANDIDFDGNLGIDTFNMSGETNVINLDLSLTTGTVNVGAQMHDLQSVENFISGTGADTLTGSADDNLIDGGFGDDVINGNGGIDTIQGGSGNDTIIMDVANFGGDALVTSTLSSAATSGTFHGGNNDPVSGGGNNFGDTLQFMASLTPAINFETIMASNAGVFQGIETLDFSNTAGAVTLDYNSVLQMTDGNNQLVIVDDGDTLITFNKDGGETVTPSGTTNIDGNIFDNYTINGVGGPVTVLVDQNTAGTVGFV